MTEIIYWLWLQKCIGYAESYKELLEYFGTPEKLYKATDEERKQCPFLARRKRLREKLNQISPDECESIISLCKKHNIHILTPDSENFPERLKVINNPPAALFVRGDVDCLKNPFPIAVIGSRTPSKYGEESAKEIVSGLVMKTDALIVSGGAMGIDTVVHTAALENGGKTVLVLGHGHGHNYLPENKEMRKKVFQSGALISEYPPLTPVTRGTFPERNRIISGLSRAVVIIEAAERSGTFSTANHAQKQQRELFVLPGDIKSGNFAGSNQLISDGAKAVFSAEEIISYYDGVRRRKNHSGPKNDQPFQNIDVASEFSKKRGRKPKKAAVKTARESKTIEKESENNINIIKKLPETISKNAEIVYNLMSDGKCTLDELANNCELLPAKILAALTELELEGFVTKTADAYRLI